MILNDINNLIYECDQINEGKISNFILGSPIKNFSTGRREFLQSTSRAATTAALNHIHGKMTGAKAANNSKETFMDNPIGHFHKHPEQALFAPDMTRREFIKTGAVGARDHYVGKTKRFVGITCVCQCFRAFHKQ